MARTPSTRRKNPEEQVEHEIKVVGMVIPPLQEITMPVRITGNAPYMQLRFSQKAMNKMMATQQAGQQARSKKTREARDFDDDYLQAMHRLEDDGYGIPAAAFRNSLISACRTIGFKMTLAKLSIFVEQDGLDKVDGTPLVRLYGTPEKTILPVRNATGVADLRVRPMWREWYCDLRIRFDRQQFSEIDIYNLLVRAGAQVGIGEGRPDSRQSAGLGYGLFVVQHITELPEGLPEAA
jgi:hypothetical protein